MENERIRNAYDKADWQEAQLEMLRRIDSFMKEHGLVYSLDFGSMLGAVRHRGYIPWDNDIDICMLQSEYDKLLELVKKGVLPEGCALEDRSVDEDYQYVFGRFIDKSTTCFLSCTGWINNSNGLFVDVFAMRPLPHGEKKRRRAIRDFLAYDEYLNKIKRRAGNRTGAFKWRYVQLKLRQRLFGREKALGWIRKKADEALATPSPEWLLLNSGGWYDGFALRRSEWVAETVDMPVSGFKLPVFKGYLEILRADYGDGWRYWPEEGMSFSPYAADLNLPGELVAEDVFRVIDRSKAVKDLTRYKNLQIRDMFLRRFYSRYAYRAKGFMSLVHVPEKLGEDFDHARFVELCHGSGEDVRKAAAEVCAAFSAYYEVQRSERYRYWMAAIPIDPAWLASALWAFVIVRKEYWFAAKILELCHADPSMDKKIRRLESIREVEEVLGRISDMHLKMDEGDPAAVEAFLDGLSQACPEAYEARIGSAWLKSRTNPEAIRSAEEDQNLAICKDNGEYLAYYADALEALGEGPRADEMRREALEKTLNGMVILSINDKLDEGR